MDQNSYSPTWWWNHMKGLSVLLVLLYEEKHWSAHRVSLLRRDNMADILQMIFSNAFFSKEIFDDLIQILITNKSALIQTMAWCWIGDKPFLLITICVIQLNLHVCFFLSCISHCRQMTPMWLYRSSSTLDDIMDCYFFIFIFLPKLITHLPYASVKWVSIGSDNGSSAPIRRQAII